MCVLTTGVVPVVTYCSLMVGGLCVYISGPKLGAGTLLNPDPFSNETAFIQSFRIPCPPSSPVLLIWS